MNPPKENALRMLLERLDNNLIGVFLSSALLLCRVHFYSIENTLLIESSKPQVFE